jgi:aspartate/methionine/tyrosine aminotransferase
VQSAARVALTGCEADISEMVDEILANQRRLYARLASVDGVELGAPARGGMYSFFRIKGLNDSLSFCKQLAATARVGLAPGSAFSAGRRDFVRWCIATDPAKLNAGLDRFEAYLAAVKRV